LASSCFGSFQAVTLQEEPASFHIAFERPTSVTHIAWSRTITATAVQIAATGDSATLIGWTESPIEVDPVNGFYSVKLNGQRCYDECIIGGEPILLVEEIGNQNQVDPCIAWSKVRLTAGMSTAEIKPGSPPESPKLGFDDEVWEPTVIPTALATVSPAVTRTAGPTVTPSPTGISAVGMTSPLQQYELSTTGGVTSLSPSTLPEREDLVARAHGDVNEKPETSGAMRETTGLWFLGAGLSVALGVALFWRRRKTNLKE
jgi:hypothetical protein